MHELSVAQALVDEVGRLVASHGARRATRLRLRVGPLAGVVPALLATAFPLAAADGVAADAALEFSEAPIRVRCRVCGGESEAEPNNLRCRACGAWQTQVISGDEMILESLELSFEEDPIPPV